MKIYRYGLIATFLLWGSKLVLADDAATQVVLNKPYVVVNDISQSAALAGMIFRTQRQRGAPDGGQLRDATTRERGGLADSTPISNLLPPLAATAAELVKGKIATQPVKGVQGWPVLKLEDIGLFNAPSLEAAQPELTAFLAQHAFEANIKGLIDQARIN